MTLQDAEHYLLAFLLAVYHWRPHRTTGELPLARWQAPGFSPRMPASLRQLDLLLMKSQQRVVQRDGIHLHGLCYWAEELADYIGHKVQVRYDPQDVTMVVIYQGRQFLCTASAPELADLQVSLRDWMALRTQKRRSVRETVASYRDWLGRQRDIQLPLALSVEEVDAAILLERLAASRLPGGPALFPSERPRMFLTSGEEREP